MTEKNHELAPLTDEHLALGAQVAPRGEVDAPVVYGDGTEEREALEGGCGVADLSSVRVALVSGVGATQFVSTIFAGDVPAPAGCAFGAVLAGDGALLAVPLVIRTGNEEYLMMVGPDRWEALMGWAMWLAALDQDGVRPFEGVTVEDATGSLVPLLLHGPAAGEVLADYLSKDVRPPEPGQVLQTSLDKILAIVLRPDAGRKASYLALVPPAYAAVIWRSLMSFSVVSPVGTQALDGLMDRDLPWARLMRGGDRRTFPADVMRRWHILRDGGGFVGARGLESGTRASRTRAAAKTHPHGERRLTMARSQTYDFTTRVDRTDQGSLKWADMYESAPEGMPAGIVPLSVADMELPVAPEIRHALRELVDTAVLGYTGPTDAYYDACIGWQTRRHGWTPERSWLQVSPGVVPAFHCAVRILTQPGDGVIIQPPVYYPFAHAIEANGRTVVENPLVNDGGRYTIDFDDLERKAADPHTTMLILCSPHNPVGRVWTRAELERVVRICMDNDVFVVSDEIHDDLVMPGHEHTTILNAMDPADWPRAMVCTAPSKTFNLAGAQTSNIYIPDDDVRARFDREFSLLHGHLGLNAFGFTACTAAYNECGPWLDELLVLIEKNFEVLRDTLAARLPEVTVSQLEGTYLAWADFRAWGLDPDDLRRFMHEEAYLFLDEGALFGIGGEGFERFNLACPTSVLEEALTRLCDAAERSGLIRKGE